MRFLYTILPLLSAVALAQDPGADTCECPLVKCKADDAAALCQCLNNRETKCKDHCPLYQPTYIPCPQPAPSPTPTPTPTRTPPYIPTPVTSSKCECPRVACPQVWPDSCYCANAAEQRCYETCGGPKPRPRDCPPNWASARAPEPEVAPRAPEPEVVARAPEPEGVQACECDEVFCILSFPEGCYCQNAAAQTCAKKCGRKVTLQDCGPPIFSAKSFTTKVKPTKSPKPNPSPSRKPTKTKSTKPQLTPTPTLLPPNPHPVCGGGRANYLTCELGYTCIKDPFTPGCGPACDGLGICVKDKMCGGFAGWPCDEEGQVCMDDARDGCDEESGGADCGGLCVWPHRSLGEDA